MAKGVSKGFKNETTKLVKALTKEDEENQTNSLESILADL